MTQTPDSGKLPLRAERDRTVDALCAHFARDDLELAEFERRVNVAHRATSLDELNGLTRDLPALAGASAPAARPAAARPGGERAPLARPGSAPRRWLDRLPDPRKLLVAVLGGTKRGGSWEPAQQNTVLAVMGGVELDFREARLARGTTEVMVVAIMGGVEIVVPPDIHVEAGGIPLIGGFSHVGEEEMHAAPDAPVLKINGLAFMGGVDVKVRYPGETESDARRRRREERRLRKRERRRLR